MFTQNVIQLGALSAAVHELLCWHKKTLWQWLHFHWLC